MRVRYWLGLVVVFAGIELVLTSFALADDSGVRLKVSSVVSPFVFQGGAEPVITVEYRLKNKGNTAVNCDLTADGFGDVTPGGFDLAARTKSDGTATTPVSVLPSAGSQTFYLTCNDGTSVSATASVR
jgi:hypothetical protein